VWAAQRPDDRIETLLAGFFRAQKQEFARLRRLAKTSWSSLPEPEPATEPAAGEQKHQAEAQPDPELHPLDEQVARAWETVDELKAQQAARKANADYHARVEREREARAESQAEAETAGAEL
jgi:hypothetical protein